MKLYIAVPTHDRRVHVECMSGILSAWSELQCVVAWHSGSFLPRLRDRIAHAFLNESDATHLLSVDSDIAWRSTDLAALVSLDVDFAFGQYRQKNPRRLLCQTGLIEQSGDLAEWERCGAGFLLLSRSCVNRLTTAAIEQGEVYIDTDGIKRANLHGTQSWVDRETGEHRFERVAEGEDFALCRRWRALGGRIYTDPRVELRHIGEFYY